VGVVLSLIPHEVVTVAEHDGTVGMGAAIGGIRLAQALGPALGPAVAGIIDDRVGFTGALVGATAMLVIGLVTDTWRRKWIQLPSAIESL
jgi:MFS family permease